MTKFEATARDIKARKLADVLIAHGATADAVTGIPESHRAITAELAGVRNPSPLTWIAVAELVAAHNAGPVV